MDFQTIDIDFTQILTLLAKFALNISVFLIITQLIYKKFNKNREFLFTFGIFNIIIFLICYHLSNATLSIGFSFGLFAIFSILRYRTIPLPVKEMTYFFLSISIAIINSLSAMAFTIPELFVVNLLTIVSVFTFEYLYKDKELMKYIKYEKIDLLKPNRHNDLLDDLKARTGLPINRVEIGRIDFLRDTADIRVFYKSNNGHFVSDYIGYDDDDD